MSLMTIYYLTLLRRIHWKLRWVFLKSPFVIRKWHHGFQVSLPLSGSAAQIYYRRYSEPQVVRWMQNHLQEGDCFVDVGAHIGEYSLIAAAAIGPAGKLIALEPQSDLCEIIAKNFSDNCIKNYRVVHGALGAHNGRCHLFTDSRTKGAILDTHSDAADTPMYDLPSLLGNDIGSGRVWMKLDAAGYELPCLAACRNYLKDHPIHLILKAYNEREVRNRFPDVSLSLAGLLDSLGYICYKLVNDIPTAWDGTVDGYCTTILCMPSGLYKSRAEI